MSSLPISSVVFALALILIAIRLPIGLVLTTCAFLSVAWEASPNAALGLLSRLPFETATNWEFSAAPMFLFMGFIAARAGLTSGLFAAASGSSVATSAAMSRIAVPETRKRGYAQGLACGTVAASGTLGSLIPPSLTLILFGIMADVSIGQLFLTGLIPGILSALIYMIMISTRVALNPALAGAPITREELSGVKWSAPHLVRADGAGQADVRRRQDRARLPRQPGRAGERAGAHRPRHGRHLSRGAVPGRGLRRGDRTAHVLHAWAGHLLHRRRWLPPFRHHPDDRGRQCLPDRSA